MTRLRSTTVFMSFILVVMLLAVGFSVIIFSIIPPARDILTAEVIASNSEPFSKSGVNIPVAGSQIYFIPVLHLRETRAYDIGEATLAVYSDGEVQKITCPPKLTAYTNYVRLCLVNIPLTKPSSSIQVWLESGRIDRTYVSNIPLANMQVVWSSNSYTITRLEIYSQQITGGIVR
ncbi:MAG: hypothetical protein QXV23_06210 [Candidatus Bathyarchaeia archaeon]